MNALLVWNPNTGDDDEVQFLCGIGENALDSATDIADFFNQPVEAMPIWPAGIKPGLNVLEYERGEAEDAEPESGKWRDLTTDEWQWLKEHGDPTL